MLLKPEVLKNESLVEALSDELDKSGTPYPLRYDVVVHAAGWKHDASVYGRVERFDGRGTEPFELFTSEFGQNSFKIQELSLENLKFWKMLKLNFF